MHWRPSCPRPMDVGLVSAKCSSWESISALPPYPQVFAQGFGPARLSINTAGTILNCTCSDLARRESLRLRNVGAEGMKPKCTHLSWTQ